MTRNRQQRNEGADNPRRSSEERGREQPDRSRGRDRARENDRALGGFGKGSSRDRMGSEQFGSQQQDFGGQGEQDSRDFGRGQPGGVYDHAGRRDYRHGSGYGGFGESPGESGGGLDSGRSYAAEPGWGPGYGDHGYGSGRSQEDTAESQRRHGSGQKPPARKR